MVCGTYLYDLRAVLEVREGPHDVLVDQFDRLLPVSVEATYELGHLPYSGHTDGDSLKYLLTYGLRYTLRRLTHTHWW